MKLFFLFLIFFSLVRTSSAQLDVGFSDGEPVVEIVQPTVPINYSAQNVNNSQYFQGYTPSTLMNWMQITFDTLYQSIGNYLNRDDNVAWTNETNTFTEPQTFQNITIETKIETSLNPNPCFKFKSNGDVGVSLTC